MFYNNENQFVELYDFFDLSLIYSNQIEKE